jgi:Phage tail protein E.
MTISKKITLKTGLKSGKTTITEFTIRKPVTGDLRGVKLLEFIDLDIDSLAKVLPRITTPSIAEHEVYTLDLIDLSEITKEVINFLSPNSNDANKESLTE